jgi:hypothetical protein
LHAECHANRQHQETRFQFVHDSQLLYAAAVPRIRYELYIALHQLVT